MRAEAEVLDGLSRVLGAPKKERIRASRGPYRELVERQALPPSGEDARAGGGGESQRGDAELGDLEKPVVVGDGADDDDRLAQALLAGAAALGIGDDAGDGYRGPVDAGHEEAAEDDLIEIGVGAAWSWSGITIHLTSRTKTSTYGSGSDTASREGRDIHCRSWARCGASSAHDGDPNRYLLVKLSLALEVAAITPLSTNLANSLNRRFLGSTLESFGDS